MFDKIVLVTRKTRLEGLVERFNTRPQAQFYVNQSGGDFNIYAREHEVYQRAVATLFEGLRERAPVHKIERAFLPNFVFAPQDLVVTIGIDGLVVNTAKYVQGQPIVAVNPDPETIDGLLLPFTPATALPAIDRMLLGAGQTRQIVMAQARLNDGQTLLAFNDLFIGPRSHVSARYKITHGEHIEAQSSSGVLVSTGIGATGWLSSMYAMAGAIAGQPLRAPQCRWEDERLHFVVREPFVSKTSRAGLVHGIVVPGQPLVIESQMPDGGVIFSDGVERDFLAFNSGATATIEVAQKRTALVV